MKRLQIATWVVVLAALAAGLPDASAQVADFPQRAVKIVVPFPPGGAADSVPRLIGERLQARWAQPVVVENQPGAAGTVGSAAVARATPDGYTLLATPAGPLVINRFVQNAFPFDPLKLAPIAVAVTIPTVLTVRPSLPAATVAEFIAHGKARQGQLNYASPGPGSTQHLSAVLFQNMTGLVMAHVTYKGSAPALADMIGGHVDLMFDNLGSSLPLHREGKVKILGVATAARVGALPDVPTIAEAGVPGYQSSTWIAFAGPPGMPQELALRISADIGEIIRNSDIAKQFAGMGMVTVGSTPEQTGALIAADSKKWEGVVAAAKLPKQ